MCWIIPSIVGILSALLGYWLSKDNKPDNEDELFKLRHENAELRKDFVKDGTKKALFIEKMERLLQDYREETLLDPSLGKDQGEGDAKNQENEEEEMISVDDIGIIDTISAEPSESSEASNGLRNFTEEKTFFVEMFGQLLQEYKEGKNL